MTDYKKALEELADTLIKEGGSDLHLSEGRHPMIRVAGFLVPLLRSQVLTGKDTEGFMEVLLNKENADLFAQNREIDFSWNYDGKARFRGNGFYQRGAVSLALRLIPNNIKTLQELHLPPIL